MNSFTDEGSTEQMNLDAGHDSGEGLILLLMQQEPNQSLLPENICKQPRDLHTLMWGSNH